MASTTENALRKRLNRRGYALRKWRDSYGVSGYVIVDSCNVVVYGGETCLLDLDNVAEWIEWLDANS